MRRPTPLDGPEIVAAIAEGHTLRGRRNGSALTFTFDMLDKDSGRTMPVEHTAVVLLQTRRLVRLVTADGWQTVTGTLTDEGKAMVAEVLNA